MKTTHKDYYDTLGISRDASPKDVRKAYRKLARKYHPDTNTEAGAADNFKQIGEAYEVLKDPDKRAKYDQFGPNWKHAPDPGQYPPGYEGVRFDFGSESPHMADDFATMFGDLLGNRQGGSGGWRSRWGRRGDGTWSADGVPHEAHIRLNLEQAAKGGKRDITLTDPATGKARKYAVTIPTGVLPGQKIRLPGQGGKAQGNGKAGDLFLVVDMNPHPRFRLEGRDLHTTLRLAPWEAALGAKVHLNTLDGPITVKVPAVSSSGRRIRIKGKGYPAGGGKMGDLYAEVQVVVPDRLTAREKELYEQLARASSFSPRPGVR